MSTQPAKDAPVEQRFIALDGLRGCAIASVLIYHFAVFVPSSPIEQAIAKTVRFGWVGVDLFFVLSGFLITRILLSTLSSPHYFRTFYIRRALRIFPLYYAFLTVWGVFLAIAHSKGYLKLGSQREEIWFWIYMSNWYHCFVKTSLPGLAHFWSLAVEEQYYMFWPLLIWLRRGHIAGLCLGVALCSFVLRLLFIQAEGGIVYQTTPFRLDGFAFGALATIAHRRLAQDQLRRVANKAIAFGLGITACAILIQGSAECEGIAIRTFGYTSIAICFAGLVLHCIAAESSFTRLMRSRFLTNLGKYSYGLYVLQGPLAESVHYFFGGPLTGASAMFAVVAGSGVTYCGARISWWAIERPALSLKRWFRYETRGVGARVDDLRTA